MASILVIDSEETVRTVVSRILNTAGHQVRATGDFSDAIRILRQSSTDLVLTNVFLQGITGREAIAALRNEFPGIRVLMVSGLPDDESIRELQMESRFDVFPKPFKASLLVDKVSEMLHDTDGALKQPKAYGMGGTGVSDGRPQTTGKP
jgi:DNA-binding NtrC family response regulator